MMEVTSSGSDYNSSTSNSAVVWSGICRDETILVEASTADERSSAVMYDAAAVARTARGLLDRSPTPGYEYYSDLTQNIQRNVGQMNDKLKRWGHQLKNRIKSPNNNNGNVGSSGLYVGANNTNMAASAETAGKNNTSLRGIKFHVYEHVRDEDENSQNENAGPAEVVLRIWVFAAVYDRNRLDQSQMQSFLEKMVTITEFFRQHDENWIYGDTLACQAAFAPVLLQRMKEVTYLGKMAVLEDQVERSKLLMEQNIRLIMEREESLQAMHSESTKLQEMASVFKKRTQRVRRMKMMQNAKHGLILGTAVTAGVAIVIVPPLVAIL